MQMKTLKIMWMAGAIIGTCNVTLGGERLGNPIVNHRYTADPSAHVFNDTLWVYPSHDKDDALGFTMEDYHAYYTTDMEHWTDAGVIFNPITDTQWAKEAAWAPDCVKRDGKYYLYYPTDKRHIGVAVAQHPAGPFKDPLGHPLLSIDSPGVICDRDFIDPCVLIDDDGQAYMYVGQNTLCCIKLNEDMTSYDGQVHIIEGTEEFFEAAWVHKREGVYYLSYSNSPFTGHQPQIVYCTSQSPLGPFTYQGMVLGPVNSGTNHHSIVNYKGEDYLFYHTADLSKRLHDGFHCGVRRSICCDKLYYDKEGKIETVKPTIDSARLCMNDVPAQRREALIVGSIQETKFGKRVVNFTHTGADARQKLQQTIDQCSADGGGMVVVLAGDYAMDGPLELKSNVRLHLRDGVILRFTDEPERYLPTVLTRWEGTELYGRSSMIHAHGQTNIALTGEGTATIIAGGRLMARWGMPGGDPNFVENVHGTHGETPEKADVERLRTMGETLEPIEKRVFGEGTKLRPCAIELNDCKQVLLEGFTLKESPFWCIHPLYCEDVVVRRVTLDSHYPNNDGCDPESCRRVLIEDCTFRTGDDAVAIKSGRDRDGRRVNRPSQDIVIRNCRFYSKCNGLCIGSEMSGGVRNVVMRNIEVGDVKNALLFKSNLDRGGYIETVAVDSVTIRSAAGAALRFETNYFGYRGGNYPARYSDFSISHVEVGEAGAYAIYYDGNEAEPIRNIAVEDFCVRKALHPHYLYYTKDCSFRDCWVNGVQLPEQIAEDKTRKACDVW